RPNGRRSITTNTRFGLRFALHRLPIGTRAGLLIAHPSTESLAGRFASSSPLPGLANRRPARLCVSVGLTAEPGLPSLPLAIECSTSPPVALVGCQEHRERKPKFRRSSGC